MAYNLATIRNRVLNDKLDDPSFNNAILDNFINDAQRDIFSSYELPFMEKTFSGILSDGETIFIVPTDCQIIQSIKITDPTGYQRDISESYLPFREFNVAYPTPVNNSEGAPSRWTLFSNKLYIDKPTDQTYTLEIYYIKTPVTLAADTDVPEVPEMFQEALILGAYYRCLQHNEDYDLAATVEQSYNTLLGTLAIRLNKRQTSTPQKLSIRSNTIVHRRRGRV